MRPLLARRSQYFLACATSTPDLVSCQMATYYLLAVLGAPHEITNCRGGNYCRFLHLTKNRMFLQVMFWQYYTSSIQVDGGFARSESTVKPS